MIPHLQPKHLSSLSYHHPVLYLILPFSLSLLLLPTFKRTLSKAFPKVFPTPHTSLYIYTKKRSFTHFTLSNFLVPLSHHPNTPHHVHRPAPDTQRVAQASSIRCQNGQRPLLRPNLRRSSFLHHRHATTQSNRERGRQQKLLRCR